MQDGSTAGSRCQRAPKRAVVSSVHATSPSHPGFERPYSSTWDGRTGTLFVHGTVDQVSASAFRDDLLRRGGTADTGFVVDLCDVDFFSAAGVGALVAGLKAATAAKHQLDVRVADGTLPHRVLRICGIRCQLA